jgi:hypothetical protein
MSSRLSLGGGASRSALRDSSSRYNSRRRQSFGGGGGGDDDEVATPQKTRRGFLDTAGSFRDGSSGSSATRAASAPRRQSLGGDALRTETPIRDRRAMLQAWRNARVGEHDDSDTKKRTRADPPLPPSSSYTPNSRKLQRSTAHSQESDDHILLSQNSSVNYYDEENENRSLLSARTPMSRRGKLGSARRHHTPLGRNVAHSYEGKISELLSNMTL